MSETATDGIAVVGLACRFPGANSADELWANLRAGKESITFFTAEELKAAGVDPRQLDDPRFVAAKGVVDEVDGFDAGFFSMSPREAALMDPQQRVFLETAWSALEDAGYEPRNYPGAIGVFAGSILSIYLLRNLWPNRDMVAAAGNFQTAVGNDPTFLATRTSYQLDLRGPSISVGTACSTSLVAVHLACQSLLSYESDMALAGGVSVHLPLVGGYRYEDGGILSPDGHCRPFDADARGTVSSDGAGVVVLKRLADAVADGDVIHAVIRGSAINNDGRLKVAYTAPSSRGEAQVIAEAMAMAGVDPASLSLVETHGAGTLLGDPIEVAALLEAFGDCGGQRQFCALGSVKSNIGHVDAAAGIAGLIKAVLSLRHAEIPPTLHFTRPNPQIDFRTTPFYVNSELRPMPRGSSPLRAGVNSFGIGGTNAHIVLEEAPRSAETPAETERPFDLLTLSARTETALEEATDRLAAHLEHEPSAKLADVGYTLRHGRRGFPHRRTVIAATTEEAIAALRTRDPQRTASGATSAERPAVTFLFPGLGDHYAGMGWELYCTEPAFRETVDRCARLLAPHLEGDIRDFLYPSRDWRQPVLEKAAAPAGGVQPTLDLRAMLANRKGAAVKRDSVDDQPAAAQPAIFVTELALAELLRGWGVEPEAMIGHSIGEFTAACISGVLSLEDALEVVATRARLIQSRVAPGAMLAVPLPEEELTPLLGGGVSLAAVNAYRLCIASGEEAAVVELAARLTERGISSQRLRSTHAYHSQMMEALVEPLTEVLRRVKLHPPRIPYVSCITGDWIRDEEATDAQYWARHLCRTVRFQQGLSTLLEEPSRVLLEVGPGQGLTAHAIAERSRVPGRENAVIPTMRWSYGLQAETAVLLRGVGQLWMAGGALDTSRFLARQHQQRVSLPTYPFERQRYWIDPPADGVYATGIASGRRKPDVADWFYLPCWKPSVRPHLPADQEVRGNWLLFVDPSGAGDDLARDLRGRGASVVTVLAGSSFAAEGDAFVIDPREAGDYRSLLDELTAREWAPENIVHLWMLTANEEAAPTAERFTAVQDLGFHSVVRLIQALCREGLEGSVKLHLVANHLNEVSGDEPLTPEKATLRAPAMVAPQEHPGLACRTIDTDIPPDDAARRDALVGQLLGELLGDATEPLVAYRRKQRWLPAYEPVRLEAVPEQRLPFRRHGVYLLTGGLGGVGMVLARHLAQRVAARLVLIGRTPFPERNEWDGWLAEHEAGDSTSLRIEQIRAMEALGAEVLVLRADVSSRDEMEMALAAVTERFGELHGVIHAAGAVGLETFREIRQASTADSEKQFVAKVQGLMVLGELLADQPLDFCLLMSSLSAILGGLGFAAYTAANLFMDAFARWKNRGEGTRWTSVDWDSWRLADMRPVIAGLGATVSEFVMEPDEGASACERILAEGDLGQVVVSSGDLQARLRLWIDRRGAAGATQSPTVRHERPNMRTAYEAPRGELERDLAEIWQELFGVAAVGIHDNFFELGGHSLLATQLNARLSSKLHVEMSLATLLQVPTIADLAVAIVSQQAESADPEALEAMLAELGDLSSDEMQDLLAGGGDE